MLNAHLRDNLLETAPAKVTTAGDIVYATGANALARLAVGSSNQGLYVSGGAPAWGASTKSTLTTTGDMVYASAANTLARMAIGGANTVVHGGSTPSYSAVVNGDTNFTWTTWTPTLDQSGSVAITVNVARYVILGKVALVQFRVTTTAAGGGSTAITMALPAGLAAANPNAHMVVGAGVVVDNGTAVYTCNITASAAQTLSFYGYNVAAAIAQAPAFTLASGDVLAGSLCYELA